MNTFSLKIVTPEGMVYEGEAQRLIVRTTEGDLTILPRHIHYAASLAEGTAAVVDKTGQRRSASCSGGILSVMEGAVNLISPAFHWDNG